MLRTLLMLKLSLGLAANLSATPEEENDPKKWFTIPGLHSGPTVLGPPPLFSQHSGTKSSTDSSPPAPKSTSPNGSLDKYLPSQFNLSSRGGRGLGKTLSPETLPEGELAAGAFVMNFDRNPGDIDFFEFPFQGALGLPGRTEVFVSVSPTYRVNSVGQDPLNFPVPPLDLFIDTFPTVAERPEPYFLYAQEVPYKTYYVPNVTITLPGNGAFASSDGDVVFGGKVNLLSEERANALGFGVRGYVEVPMETPRYNDTSSNSAWRELTGVSGKVDVGLDLLFSKRVVGSEVLANVGYKRVGDPDRGLRIQYVDSSRKQADRFLVGDPVEFDLNLRDELFFAAGGSFPGFKIRNHQMWFFGEFTYTRYIGNGTATERLVHPAEMVLGLQINFPWYKPVSLGFAWQILFNDAGDGDNRTTFLQLDGVGDINFSELVQPELSEEVKNFFADRGATFSEGSSKVFSTDNPAFDGWRNITTDRQRIVGKGGGNLLVFITWRIASLW